MYFFFFYAEVQFEFMLQHSCVENLIPNVTRYRVLMNELISLSQEWVS